MFLITGHQPKEVPHRFLIVCCVCKLEDGIQNVFHRSGRVEELEEIMGTALGEIKRNGSYDSYRTHNIAACTDDKCFLHVNSVCIKSNNVIFNHPQLIGLTCFEIAHHTITKDLCFQS